MLSWTSIFAALPLLIGTLGSIGITAEAGGIIKSLFFLFLHLATLKLMLGLSVRPQPQKHHSVARHSGSL